MLATNFSVHCLQKIQSAQSTNLVEGDVNNCVVNKALEEFHLCTAILQALLSKQCSTLHVQGKHRSLKDKATTQICSPGSYSKNITIFHMNQDQQKHSILYNSITDISNQESAQNRSIVRTVKDMGTVACVKLQMCSFCQSTLPQHLLIAHLQF